MRHRVAFDRRGFSITELVVVLTVIGILLSVSVPSFQRSLEHARLDVAAANLRAIWSAQRLFWLENRRYATSLTELGTLIDPTIASSQKTYAYAVSAAEVNAFLAQATRIGSSTWGGTLSIDETGVVTGNLQAVGQPILVPGFQ